MSNFTSRCIESNRKSGRCCDWREKQIAVGAKYVYYAGSVDYEFHALGCGLKRDARHHAPQLPPSFSCR